MAFDFDISVKYVNNIDFFSFCGKLISLLIISFITLSTPIPKPTPGVLFPPIFSINPLYLPPPTIAFCLLSLSEIISNTV